MYLSCKEPKKRENYIHIWIWIHTPFRDINPIQIFWSMLSLFTYFFKKNAMYESFDFFWKMRTDKWAICISMFPTWILDKYQAKERLDLRTKFLSYFSVTVIVLYAMFIWYHYDCDYDYDKKIRYMPPPLVKNSVRNLAFCQCWYKFAFSYISRTNE